MKIVVLNVGNSRVTAALTTGAAVEEPAAVLQSGAAAPGLHDLRLLLVAATPVAPDAAHELAQELASLPEVRAGAPVALVSVVPSLDAPFTAALSRLLRIDHTLPWPFPLAVQEPSTVGADRLCNAAAAVAGGLADAIVVDAGTATTFDVVQGGAFVGGLIAPGMALAASALTARAARLEPQPFGPVPLQPARDTATAIRAGCYHVGRQGVLGTLAELRRSLGSPPVIFTGGLAAHVAGDGDLVDPFWTLRGAAAAARQMLAGES
ncbi:MAG: type III pantothenate kinase [Candidatus Krumholzibacteriia bacterium]